MNEITPSLSIRRKLRGPIAALALSLFAAPLLFAGTGCSSTAQADGATRAVNARRAAEYDAVVHGLEKNARAALPDLQQLAKSDRRNALPCYLQAVYYARQGAWERTYELMRAGNRASECILYVAPDAKEKAPATLEALKDLADLCATAAPRLSGSESIGEELLWECAILSRRLTDKAEPRTLEVLKASAAMRIAVENGRVILFEKEGRFGDADGARERLREGKRLLNAARSGQRTAAEQVLASL